MIMAHHYRTPMRIAKSLLVLFLVFTSLHSLSAADKPKLVVVLSYDQLRYDRLSCFAEDFGANGFKRVLNEGARYDSCLYNHAINMTGPGHAVLLSGYNPHRTGIVGNDFFDRKKNRQLYATEDTSGVLSPRNLRVPTIGDVLKRSSPESKVIGIALKDRAAIFMSGHSANYALWLNDDKRNLGTSAHYRAPKWLAEFNDKYALSGYAGKTWNALQAPPRLPDPREVEQRVQNLPPGQDPTKILPPITLSQRITMIDDVPWEGNFPGGGRAFPHSIPSVGDKEFVDAFSCTPYSIDWIMEAVRMCMLEEKLGKDDATDILCVGISTTDEVGHVFGPHSREMKEILISADRSLASFIDFLDKEVGREHYELVISSDHGVAEVPENAMINGGMTVGRLSRKQVDSAITAPFQRFAPLALGGEDTAPPPSFVKRFIPPFLFIDSAAVKSMAQSFSAACDSLAVALRSLRGIGYVVTLQDVRAGKRPAGMEPHVFDCIVQSVDPERSGDIIVFPSRGWIFGSKTTTHGTPYDYDQHVPLMFFGGGMPHAVHTERVSPADLAPTLAKQLGLPLGPVDGKALEPEKIK
jgi:predicted AlkP superfamily pyrophosphatase or phosphodiesterase